MYVVPQSGSTALLVAGMDGYSEVVKLLLQAGARDIPNKVEIYQQSECVVWTCMHVHEVCVCVSVFLDLNTWWCVTYLH